MTDNMQSFAELGLIFVAVYVLITSGFALYDFVWLRRNDTMPFRTKPICPRCFEQTRHLYDTELTLPGSTEIITFKVCGTCHNILKDRAE